MDTDMGTDIRIENISKSYGDLLVLEHFSLSLPARGIIGLSGASGLGKTTLLRILAGLEAPDAGKIEGLANKRISMVFQEDRLLPWMSLFGNLSAVQPETTVVRYYLDCLQLTAHANAFPHELSGGMQRRAALARALAYGGDLFILDEPFKGLDIKLKEQIFPHILDLGRNSLVLFVSHEEKDFTDLADRTIYLEGLPPTVNYQ